MYSTVATALIVSQAYAYEAQIMYQFEAIKCIKKQPSKF